MRERLTMAASIWSRNPSGSSLYLYILLPLASRFLPTRTEATTSIILSIKPQRQLNATSPTRPYVQHSRELAAGRDRDRHNRPTTARSLLRTGPRAVRISHLDGLMYCRDLPTTHLREVMKDAMVHTPLGSVC